MKYKREKKKKEEEKKQCCYHPHNASKGRKLFCFLFCCFFKGEKINF